MARKTRPAGVTVIAVFNLVLGFPCLLGSLCAPFAEDFTVAMMQAMPKPAAGQGQDPVKMVKDQQDFMRKEIPAQKPLMIVFAVLQLSYSLLLLISGIALLGGKPIGRKLGIAAAVLMAVTTLASVAFNAAFVIPATSKWEKQQQQANPQGPPQLGASIGGAAGIACSGVIGLSYSAIALIVLLSRPAKEYFAGGPGADAGADNNPDDFDRPDGRFRPRDDFDDR